MNRHKNFIILLLIFVIHAGCSQQSNKSQLEYANRLIARAPIGGANALTISEYIDEDGILVLELRGEMKTEFQVDGFYNALKVIDRKRNVRVENKLTISTRNPTSNRHKYSTPQDKRYVTADTLNFRDAPRGNKLGSLPFGSEVVVYKKDGKWLQISKGLRPPKWIHEDYVSQTKPQARTSSSNSRNQSNRAFKEIGDNRRYGISRSLETLKGKCSYRQMAQFSVGEYDSGGCRYVVKIIQDEPNHPYVTNLTRYMNSSLWP